MMLVTKFARPNSLIVNNCIKVGCVFSTPDTVRTMLGNKHWNPKWRKYRALKVIPVDIPDYQKDRKSIMEMSPEEQRSWFKEIGMQPNRPWDDTPFSVISTTGIIDQYLPPEGDGKLSPLNSAGAKQKIEWLKKKSSSWKAVRDIRKYDEDFELYPDFVDKAQDVYIKAHEALAAGDTEKLIDYVTEKAYPIMLFNCHAKTMRWSFVKSLEPPRVCHVRTMELHTKYNKFAQITIRLHTQQTLAIYDRFGRLMYGSESVGKDVLEYVVFENHITSNFGAWRLHHKIIPDWVAGIEASPRTYVKEEEDETPHIIEKSASMTEVPT